MPMIDDDELQLIKIEADDDVDDVEFNKNF
jgi:hypothetical protein